MVIMVMVGYGQSVQQNCVSQVATMVATNLDTIWMPVVFKCGQHSKICNHQAADLENKGRKIVEDKCFVRFELRGPLVSQNCQVE